MHTHITIHTQIRWVIVWLIIAFTCISIRLFYLQITRSEHYMHKGEKNFLRIEADQSQRGNILDRHGVILATNRPVTNLFWQGTGNRPLSEEQLEILQDLELITGQPIYSNNQMIAQLSMCERQYKKTQIAADLSFEQLSKIKEKFPDNHNISISTHFKRYYPHGKTACHILGYLGRIDQQFSGKMGLEKLCDDLLKGQDGVIIKTINSVGRDIENVQLKDAAHGATIQTTIDFELQKMAESIFPDEYAGALLIMDPKDGSILASVSSPTFDPALFLSPIRHDEWNNLQENQSFINRALNAYPPGSIFKLVSACAFLEKHMIEPDHELYCKGYVTFADRRYWCNKRWGHGHLNAIQAVAHSCNTLFFQLGKKIDIDVINTYARKFGLGQPTGVIFPERSGIVPSREWKLKNKGEPWWPGETLSVAIGQSFLLATPLQIARMVGSIFTGYLVKPRILLSEEIETMPLSLKNQTRDFLKESMKYVVAQGTGRRVSSVKDIDIYAKTSTAQISDLQKRKLSTEFYEHAWFVAYCTYKNYEPFVFVILIENAGTSQIPTLIAKQLLIAYKELKNKTTFDYNEKYV